MQGFIEFIREQGVVGLAIGFILGGAVTGLTNSFVNDLINPFLGLILGAPGQLESMSLSLGPVEILWGSFAMALINFITIAAVVYFGFKGLGLDKLDKPKKK
jgi:large conductance mechanosensitive channel